MIMSRTMPRLQDSGSRQPSNLKPSAVNHRLLQAEKIEEEEEEEEEEKKKRTCRTFLEITPVVRVGTSVPATLAMDPLTRTLIRLCVGSDFPHAATPAQREMHHRPCAIAHVQKDRTVSAGAIRQKDRTVSAGAIRQKDRTVSAGAIRQKDRTVSAGAIRHAIRGIRGQSVFNDANMCSNMHHPFQSVWFCTGSSDLSSTPPRIQPRDGSRIGILELATGRSSKQTNKQTNK
jgi:hypothetical protein